MRTRPVLLPGDIRRYQSRFLPLKKTGSLLAGVIESSHDRQKGSDVSRIARRHLSVLGNRARWFESVPECSKLDMFAASNDIKSRTRPPVSLKKSKLLSMQIAQGLHQDY